MAMETVFTERAARRRIVLDVLSLAVQAACLWYSRRITERALARLNDRELKDIGLVRTSTGYNMIRWDRDLLNDQKK